MIQQSVAEELIYRTVDDPKDYSKEDKGQYYIRLIARYAHFRDDTGKKGIWDALKDLFKGEDNPKVLVVASADYRRTGAAERAGSILLSLDPTDKKYDVISIDATSPKCAGNGSLYALEFYESDYRI